MSLRRWTTLALVVLVVLPLGGCGGKPDPKDSAASLRKSRAQVIGEVEKVGFTLSSGSAKLTEASGSYSACGSAPTEALQYGGGGKVAGDPAPIADRIDAATATLETAGWKLSDSGSAPPYANLAKDGLRLSLRPDVLRGSDALAFGVVGDCVRVTTSQVSEFDQKDQIFPKG